MSRLGPNSGTSGRKAAVFSEDSRILASAYEEYDFLHPQPGQAEHNTQRVWHPIGSTRV